MSFFFSVSNSCSLSSALSPLFSVCSDQVFYRCTFPLFGLQNYMEMIRKNSPLKKPKAQEEIKCSVQACHHEERTLFCYRSDVAARCLWVIVFPNVKSVSTLGRACLNISFYGTSLCNSECACVCDSYVPCVSPRAQ